MRVFSWAKDGGPQSPVDAFFVCEFKSLLSIALLRFNCGGREAYHTHAFNALTWFLYGDLEEYTIDGCTNVYKRSLFPKVTLKTRCHRVYANKTSWCLTIRGPWAKTWTEVINGKQVTLTHGRVIQ